MLCKEFDLDPLADGVVIDHAEGYKRGIASNHGDVAHWFKKYGKSMDIFRSDVAALLPQRIYRVQLGAYTVRANAQKQLEKIRAAGFRDAFIREDSL